MQFTTQKKQFKKAPFLAVGCILVVLALGWLYYAHHFQKWPFLAPANQTPETPIRATNYSPPTKEETTAGNTIKQNVADAAASNSTSTPQTSGSIPVTITTVQPGDTVYVRTILDRITSTAVCTLSMSGPNGKTYTATANTQPLASSSTCQGFNIPMSTLAPGSWSITVTVKDGAATGSASTEKTL